MGLLMLMENQGSGADVDRILGWVGVDGISGWSC